MVVVLYGSLFWFFWEYYFWRGKPLSLFSANKALAIAAVVLFCLSGVFGPLHRFFGGLPRMVRLRRPFGIVAAFFALVHIGISLWLLASDEHLISKKTLIGYLLTNWLSMICGLAATIGFGILWATSYTVTFQRFGPELWQKLHALTWVFLILVLLHFAVVGINFSTNPYGKISNWVKWFQERKPPLPPGTMIPFAIGMLALLLKAADCFFTRRRKSSLNSC
ncbi:MAG: ferric reductase-like transmembrane domain-containing protein [Planctomycetota bacterium]